MAKSFAERITAQVQAVPITSVKVAVFVAREGFKAVVSTGESVVTLPFNGQALPPAGHPVQLEYRANQLVVAGPARPLPQRGVITGVGSPLSTVASWGIDYDLPTTADYLPVVGDVVELSWSLDGGLIRRKAGEVATAVAPETIPASTEALFHPGPFTAIDSGTFNPSYRKWISADVWASDSTTGAWFVGPKVRNTIPDNAQTVSAAIYLNPRQVVGDAPILQVHTSASRPGGAVVFVGAGYALPARSGWVKIPLEFIDYLKVNDGGLGLNHGGYSIFRGTQADALSGALDISWKA